MGAKMSDTAKKLEQVGEELNQKKQEYYKILQKHGHEMFQEFFKSFPQVEAIVWTQGTPSWNDGAPCYFGVHDLWPMAKEWESIKDKNGEPEFPDITGWREGLDEGISAEELSMDIWGTKELKPIHDALNALQRLDSDFYERAFNGDAMVIATADGFDVRDYDMDY